jgi:peptidoglycan hydrolase-like protein with peptidoglycan-binding domain
MKFLRFLVVLIGLLSPLTMAQAQDRVWVQVEAQPTLREAEDRARAYAGAFPDVSGYQLRSGWYAILLGPYGVEEGAAQLSNLRRENLIPRDAFIAYGSDFRDQFWPIGGVVVPPVTEEPLLTQPEEPVVVEPVVIPEPPAADETPDEARASEALLEREDRELLQTALQWFGFYNSSIDGAFGRGTRASMAAWQEANGLEATGILTTLQRATLVGNYQADLAEYGFETVNEREAGIEVTLPLGLVAFDHYEPPFVHFAPKAGSDLRIVLISQPGDQTALYGLYDILQTLEIMPQGGERGRGERSFTMAGSNASVASVAYAEISRGLIKGYILTWNPAKADGMDRILPAVQNSFRAVGDTALDPGMVVMDAGTRAGLLAGLEVRKPLFSRSGFFVTADGVVVTTAEAVAQCGRITIERDVDMTVASTDAGTGLAILRPTTPLAAPAFASLQVTPDRIGSEIAVAGYSYEDRLSAPVLTFGGLEALEGLNGEIGVKRLAINTLAGDAGGPVVDGTGAVLGMLQPAPSDAGRQLPPDVAYATAASAIADRLKAAGITTTAATPSGALPPEDLSRKALAMTVLVSCWE